MTRRFRIPAKPTTRKKKPVKSTAKAKRAPVKSAAKSTAPLADQVDAVVAALKGLAVKRIRDEMGPRYGVHTTKAFGVSMSNMQAVAKKFGPSHELAEALWKTGWYEARMVASLVDEADKVTPAQMDRWCQDFDNWGICDTVCFKLFDRSPHALGKVAEWVVKEDEFVKRAGFALLACVALHDKAAPDAPFVKCLTLIDKGASDERNFVKKGVSWALRAIATRSPMLRAAAVKLAEKLATSPDAARRWVGKDALRELTRRR